MYSIKPLFCFKDRDSGAENEFNQQKSRGYLINDRNLIVKSPSTNRFNNHKLV